MSTDLGASYIGLHRDDPDQGHAETVVSESMTGNVFQDMAVFDRKYGFDGVDMTASFLAFRVRFMVEELFEAIQAIEKGDYPAFVDAIIDKIVVDAGTLSIGKVDGQRAWNEVRRANMSKERRANPNRAGSGGADLVKPDGWTPPWHNDNVGKFKQVHPYDFRQHFPHSVTVLFECMALQFKKYEDYNNGRSEIKRGDYWIHGIQDLEYELNKKMTRIRSLLSGLSNGIDPNFESIEDSFKDLINYASFAVAWLRGLEPGQDSVARDIFNRRRFETKGDTTS